MRISDWSSDVCSSDLFAEVGGDVCTACLRAVPLFPYRANVSVGCSDRLLGLRHGHGRVHGNDFHDLHRNEHWAHLSYYRHYVRPYEPLGLHDHARSGTVQHLSVHGPDWRGDRKRTSHTSELQSLMRISYAVFRLK